MGSQYVVAMRVNRDQMEASAWSQCGIVFTVHFIVVYNVFWEEQDFQLETNSGQFLILYRMTGYYKKNQLHTRLKPQARRGSSLEMRGIGDISRKVKVVSEIIVTFMALYWKTID